MAGNNIATEFDVHGLVTHDRIVKFKNEPVIRVREIVHENTLDFQIDGDFQVTEGDNGVMMENGNPSHRWRIRLQNPRKAKFRYSILRMECTSAHEADKCCERLGGEENGIRYMIRGSKVLVKDNLVHDGTRYWVIEGDWESETEALDKAKIYCCDDDVRVIARRVEPASCNLEIFNIEYDKFTEISSRFEIIPVNSSGSITVIRQARSERNGEEMHDQLNFSGTLVVTVDDDGRLILITQSSLENYLKRVISISRADRVPEEYVKAFAIARRGELIHLIADRRNENAFDVTWDSCDDFLNDSSIVRDVGSVSSIEKTKGQVLFHKKYLCNSVSTPICGGRTVNGPQIAGMKESSYLVGLVDSDKSTVRGHTKNLSADPNIDKWLHGNPEVHCNPGFTAKIPRRLAPLYKYFRWEIAYTRVALEELICEKLGESIGMIYDLLTVSRKPSGYIETLEILGSLRNVILHGEEQIRCALDKTMLPSCCFEVRSEVGEDGVPIEFVFHGAGWGNGVGMCHAGALAMAMDGMKHRDILNHYYKNVDVVKVY